MADTRTSRTVADAPPPPPVSPGAERQPDPHRIGTHVAGLDDKAAESGRGALAVLSVVLREGETVADLAVGRFEDAAAVVALTDQRLLLTSDRAHKADAIEFPLTDDLQVTGWQDANRATLTIADGSDSVTLDDIVDRLSAQRLAASVEARTRT